MSRAERSFVMETIPFVRLIRGHSLTAQQKAIRPTLVAPSQLYVVGSAPSVSQARITKANSMAAASRQASHQNPKQRLELVSKSSKPETDLLNASEAVNNDRTPHSTDDGSPTPRCQRSRASRIEDVTELDLHLLSLTNQASSSFSLPTPPSSNPPSPPPTNLQPAPLKPRSRRTRPYTPPLRIPRSISSPPPMRPVRLLIASLGNPPPYHSTRHSAAHILLKSLAQHLNLPPMVKNKTYGGGSVSFGTEVGRPEYTLWQSGSLMNVSGPGLLKAWNALQASQKREGFEGVEGLVVLHDELELEPGKIKVRRGGEGSARGHNGLKSVQASLKSGGVVLGDRFVKIGVGIGRPVSRERDDVSAYVLGQVTRAEKERIEAKVEEVEGILRGEFDRMGKM